MMIICGVGLDSSAKVTFQSHAHSDHFVSGNIIFSTKATKFLSHLKKSGLYKVVKFGKTFYLGDYKAKLYPAGHMLGSAQIYIEFDGFSLLYTGDVKWFKLRTAEKSKFRKADVLIIEATFGVPMYNFPSPKEAEKKLIAFVESALDKRKTPTLYANQMGKAQELLKILEVHGYTVKASRSIIKVAKIYEKFGIKFQNIDRDGEVLLKGSTYPKPDDSASFYELHVSGFGNLKLSNHADFWELIKIIEKVRPEKIYTVHGYAENFAKILRDLGYDATAIDKDCCLSCYKNI